MKRQRPYQQSHPRQKREREEKERDEPFLMLQHINPDLLLSFLNQLDVGVHAFGLEG